MTNKEQYIIDEKHIKIMKKHTSAMHKELGELYGYPKCCIDQFCKEQKVGIMSFDFRLKTFNIYSSFLPKELQHVPCDKCMRKIIKERILGKTL